MMIEMLLVLTLMTAMTVIYLPSSKEIDCSDYVFINDYMKNMSEAMLENSRMTVDDSGIDNSYPIYFTGNGNINQGQTINGNRHKIILHLGNGYLTYE